MKIEELDRYREYSEKLSCIEEQIDEYKREHTVYDAVLGDSGEPAHEQVVVPIEGIILGDGIVDLEKERNVYIRKMKEIKADIYSIPKTSYRMALKMHCMEYKNEKTKKPYTWQEVAEELGFSQGELLRRNISRYISIL